MYKPSRLFWLALLALLAMACAEERAPIDRVQPYALDKAFFVGPKLQDISDDPEFYSRATVVDVGYGAAQDGLFTSTYAQPTSRIKWQITEDLLIGRLAYERIAGSDAKGLGKATHDGIIVCAFRIQSHFDIRHAYNPTTGEEMNVLEENGSDRPWFERAKFRVDWSKNLNTDSYDFDTLSMMGIYGGIQYESLAYHVDDPTDENATYFAKDGSYFDVTTKAFAKPGVVDLSHLGWGIDKFPACFLDGNFGGGTAPAGSCNPIEITLRHSFRRVVDTDYEPMDWDGIRFQAAGAFTAERHGYARNYGMTDEKWYRMLERYNIWQQSHAYFAADAKTGALTKGADGKLIPVDRSVGKPVACNTAESTKYSKDPHRDENKDGTEDECAAVGNGSRCDTFRQMCTLPFAQRQAKPVAWYYAEGSDPEYFEPTEDATHEWDIAMRMAVQTAKYAECTRMGAADCEAKFPVYHGQQDDNEDTIALAKEVDDCRHGLAYKEKGRNEAACIALADEVGPKRGATAGVIAIAKLPEMLVLCHSPVEANDPAICAPANERLPANLTAEQCFKARKAGDKAVVATCDKAVRARRGDLRYHQVNGIVEPATPSPWGIMVDGHDPVTGEEVSASINIWTYINDMWSQGVVDQARYIAGELKAEDITEGKYIRDWSAASQAASYGGLLPRMSAEEAAERQSATSNGHNHEHAAQFAQQNPKAAQAADVLRSQLAGVVASGKASTAHGAEILARRQSAAGTAFEAALLTPMMQQLLGMVGLPMSDGLLNMVSPLRGGNPTFQRNLRQMKENALADRGACVMEMADAPLGVAGLGDELQKKFGAFNAKDAPEVQQARAQKMQRYLARRVHFAVIIHEMGHSIGLRHNFLSSADALNYRPQYWQTRTRDGAETALCKKLATDGTSCVGPRYFDPVTKEERDNLQPMFMQSSVMDYAGETTQDLIGLGAYDFHAARMFYGDVATVHADESYQVNTKRGVGALAKMDSFGGIVGLQPTIGSKNTQTGLMNSTTNIHYTDLQNKYEVLTNPAEFCHEVDPTLFKPARWNKDRDGEFSPLIDGLIVTTNGVHTRCRQQPVDYVPWNSMRKPTGNEFGGFYRGGPSVDPAGRVRVPYGFATDNWADLGNASVYRHDNGADQYEIFNFMITQGEVNHIFDNYRRGRKSFTVNGAANRAIGRYYEKMRDGAKGLALYRNIYRDFGLSLGVGPDDMWNYAAANFFPDSILAAGMVFDHFTRIAQRPEAGTHFNDKGLLLSTENEGGDSKPTALTVPNGATGFMGNVSFGGRPIENKLADDKGEYDSQYTLNAGSYYEKAAVSMLMTESVDNFISSTMGDFTDSRYRSVSLADLFPEGYRRFLANLLTNDETLKGARIASKDGKPEVDADGYPSKAIGWTSWYGTEARSCFPADQSNVCRSFGKSDTAYAAQKVAEALPIESQLGFEQQKFYIAWTMLYLFENQQQSWLDMLRIWELGVDSDPKLGDNRIELHYPGGKTYVAHTYGKEVVFGKTVQKGIAARVIEYANQLMKEAYQTTDGPDLDGDGSPDWYLPVINPKTGEASVKYDAGVGTIQNTPSLTCKESDTSSCVCNDNRSCIALKAYMQVPYYLRESIDAYSIGLPHKKGVY